MKIAIIGRTEMLYNTAELLWEAGYEIPLIITAKETPEYKKSSEDFRKLAEKYGAHFILTPSLEKEEVIQVIKNISDLQLAVSINFTGVISKFMIDLFPLGILNAHGGDLPKYRGNACQAWAMINKEDRIGLCIHKMIGGELDSGKIIARNFISIDVNTRIKQVYDWVDNVVGGLFLEACQQLQKDEDFCIEIQSEDQKDALRCYPRTPEDGEIDFKADSESILRLINASSEPYSGAFCKLNNERLIIWRARLSGDLEKWVGIPGQVSKINLDDNSIIVLCGNGKLILDEVEFKGERIKPTQLIKSFRTRLT